MQYVIKLSRSFILPLSTGAKNIINGMIIKLNYLETVTVMRPVLTVLITVFQLICVKVVTTGIHHPGVAFSKFCTENIEK
jgi:hypothetical protein